MGILKKETEKCFCEEEFSLFGTFIPLLPLPSLLNKESLFYHVGLFQSSRVISRNVHSVGLIFLIHLSNDPVGTILFGK